MGGRHGGQLSVIVGGRDLDNVRAHQAFPLMVLLNLVTFKSYFTGPLAKDLNSVDISWIVGAIVTGTVYLLLTRNLDTSAEQAAIERGDAELRSMTTSAG